LYRPRKLKIVIAKSFAHTHDRECDYFCWRIWKSLQLLKDRQRDRIFTMSVADAE
jgi:hypothetical protein